MFWPENIVLRRKLAPIAMLGLFLLWNLLAFGYRRQDLNVYLLVGGMFAILALSEFLLARLGSTPARGPRTAVDWLGAKFGRLSVIFLFVFIMGTSISGLTGMANGETEKNHLLFVENQNVAVIRIYGDKILAVVFDPKTKRLTGQTIVRKLDSENLTLTMAKDIGPLIKPQ